MLSGSLLLITPSVSGVKVEQLTLNQQASGSHPDALTQ
jgi:hypothetical protein